MKTYGMTAVEVCQVCDIADCHHIRERRATGQTVYRRPMTAPTDTAAFNAGVRAAAEQCDFADSLELATQGVEPTRQRILALLRPEAPAPEPVALGRAFETHHDMTGIEFNLDKFGGR